MQKELALTVTSSLTSSTKSVRFPDIIDFDKEDEKLERRFRKRRNAKEKKKRMASKKQKEREELKQFFENAVKDDKFQSMQKTKNVLEHFGINSLQELVEEFDNLVTDNDSVIFLALKSLKADCSEDCDTAVAVIQPEDTDDTASETSSDNSDVFDGIIDDSGLVGQSSQTTSNNTSENLPKKNESSFDPMNGANTATSNKDLVLAAKTSSATIHKKSDKQPSTRDSSSNPVASTSNNGLPAGNDESLISHLSVDIELLNKLSNLAVFVDETLRVDFLEANDVEAAVDCVIETIGQTKMNSSHGKEDTLRQLKAYSPTDRAKLLVEAFKNVDESVLTQSTGNQTEENITL